MARYATRSAGTWGLAPIESLVSAREYANRYTWWRHDQPEQKDSTAIGVLCLVRGRPVLVTEAHFGGVVAQPWSGPLPPKTVDLSQPAR